MPHPKKEKEPAHPSAAVDYLQYEEEVYQDSFTEAHQDNPRAFYDDFMKKLRSDTFGLSPLALKIAPVVLKAFNTTQARLTLQEIRPSLKNRPDIVLAALEHDIQNLRNVASDFFVRHSEQQDRLPRIILRALAADITLGKDAFNQFRQSYLRSSVAMPKLVVSSEADANVVFDSLSKLVPNLLKLGEFVKNLLSWIDWKLPLQQPGDHVFMAVRRDRSLISVFFPSHREKPETVLTLSQMGDGIAFNGRTIAKSDWFKIYNQVAPKVATGIDLYLRFLDGGGCIGKRGFFTGFRHGEKGRARANALKQTIEATMNSNDPSDYFQHIKNFFKAEDTRFHNNSLSNFIRRELVKLEEPLDREDFTKINYEKACDLFGIEDNRFTHTLPENPGVSPR